MSVCSRVELSNVMGTTLYYYKGWSWDTTDLISCKNAFCGLLRECHPDELEGIDFGNLDTQAVIDEYYEHQLNAYEAEHC